MFEGKDNILDYCFLNINYLFIVFRIFVILFKREILYYYYKWRICKICYIENFEDIRIKIK